MVEILMIFLLVPGVSPCSVEVQPVPYNEKICL